MDRSKWEYKKLGEVAKFVGGGTPSKVNEDYYTGNIPWATVRDMVNFNLSKTELCITDQAVKESATNIIPKDTIIISTHVGLGKICLLMQDTAINQDLKGVILPQSVDKMFFAAWYKSIADYVISNGKGATVKGVTMKFVNDLKIPIPPINDQQRIVAELDCLNEMIALKQEQLKEFDKLAQSIFYDMFGDILLNDKAWPVYKWKDLFDTKLGKMLDKKKQNEGDTSLPYLANVNVQWGYFDLNDLKTMTFNDREKEIFSLKKNDLLICEGGESGRCAIWMEDKTDIKFQKAIHRARVKDNSLISPLYAMFYMKEIKGKGGLKNYVSKATIEHLTGEKLNQVPVSSPPLALQQKFAEKIQAIEAQKELVKKSIAETQQLLDSRMDYYFD